MGRRKNLPKEIVEQIIARMPYPSIFKGRCLSKSWLARFGSISSQANRAKKRLAISFQEQVGECSNSWMTLCPVFAKNNQDFIAYDRISQKWRRLPSLPFIHEGDLRQELEIQTAGALLYAFCLQQIQSKKYVANILTGAWKQLPACPIAGMTVLKEKLVSCTSSEMYKVIMLCRDRRRRDIGQQEFFTLIYDSKPDAWIIKEVVFSFDLKSSDFVNFNKDNCALYLNGVLYSFTKRFGVLALNVEEGTLEKLDVQYDKLYSRLYRFKETMMVSWNNNLLIVLAQYNHMFQLSALTVLKFDFQSELLSELAQCSFPALEISGLGWPFKPTFDGHCIFFGVERFGTRMLTYNVDKNEWSRFPIPALKSQHEWEYKWVGCVFQPGLNPFVKV